MQEQKERAAAVAPSERRRTRADIQPLLTELRVALEGLYGDRLAKLILYGSFARGEATEASDIDVLVVLHGDVDEWTEIKRLVEKTYPMLLKYEELVSAHPVSEREYRTRRTPLLINVHREGLQL